MSKRSSVQLYFFNILEMLMTFYNNGDKMQWTGKGSAILLNKVVSAFSKYASLHVL